WVRWTCWPSGPCGPGGASAWWSGAWRAVSNAWSGMVASVPTPRTLPTVARSLRSAPSPRCSPACCWPTRPGGGGVGDRRNPYAGLSVEELYDSLARTKLRRRPGERVKYSNLGGGLLGDALARAAGQSYGALVRERICLPLGMRDTVITLTGEQTARLATGHTRRGRPTPPFQLPALVGAGALRSTATDMLCLLRANLDPAHSPLAAQIEHTQLP